MSLKLVISQLHVAQGGSEGDARNMKDGRDERLPFNTEPGHRSNLSVHQQRKG